MTFLAKQFAKLNSRGFAHSLLPLGAVLLIAIVGTYTLVASHANAAVNVGKLTAITYVRAGSGKALLGGNGITISIKDVGVARECSPRTSGPTNPATGRITFTGCPVATQNTPQNKKTGYPKQYDVTATINGPKKYTFDVGFLTASHLSVSGNSVTRRVTLHRNLVASTQFVFDAPAAAQPVRVQAAAVAPPATIRNTAGVDHIGGGAWIMNYTDSYYIGEVFNGWKVAVNKVSTAGWVFGNISRPDGTPYGCAWIEPNVVSSTKVTDTSCAGKDVPLSNRNSIGKGFNCAVGGCVSGARAAISTTCDNSFYYNYHNGITSDPAYDPANPAAPAKATGNLYYRFTTTDGRMAVGESKQYGWGFISKDCISGYPQGGIAK